MKEETLFEAALGVPASDRAGWLDNACGGESVMRARVEALLAADVAPSHMLDSALCIEPAAGFQSGRVGAAVPVDAAGLILAGKYKMVERIGEGGMGSVWLAQQSMPVKRKVAVKLIKVGMDSKQVLGRFEAERQALAMMDHPNIAKVLDGDLTSDGRPFFVMELVKGVPITEYCDACKLDLKERLNLFVPVCQAIQHAHQKGIIHRDIKPSNVLIALYDERPVPKVIDFGVAKATGQSLSNVTLNTAFGGVIGTPQYMSPEQATLNNLDIDTRSDVYSLGVVLYELMTGSPPFPRAELKKKGLMEMLRMVREETPLRPSTRLRTAVTLPLLSAKRGTEPGKLMQMLRNDLDWIVLKALEKNRSRRYETASSLAADIIRYLAGDPVAAHPPSTGYRIGKFLKRHRRPVFAAAMLAIVLLGGIIVSTWQAVRAKSAENRAVSALDELARTAPAFAEQARNLAARTLFDQAIEKLDYAVKLRPDVAEYLVAKGDLLQCQLKLAEASSVYRAALRVQPDLARARSSAQLCDELLSAPLSKRGRLTRESLAKLHVAMQKQQRSAAELMPVATMLGEEKAIILEYWLARLSDLPVSTDRPLRTRLSVREDGLLALDLEGTKIASLAPLAAMPLGALNLSACEGLTDLEPLRDFRSLTSLNLGGTQISDLAPLAGLPLESLNLARTRIHDLSPLRGMMLKSLSLWSTRISDLSPLKGMPLTSFEASSIPAVDYSPLAGAPLETCILQNSPVRDLAFLRGSPVRNLRLNGCTAARGYGVLGQLKSLEILILPVEFRTLPDEELAVVSALRAHPTLKNIQIGLRSPGFPMSTPPQPRADFWNDWDLEQTFVPALRDSGIRFTLVKLTSGSYSLSITDQPLRDLSILKGAPISELTLVACPVSDLLPIHELRLERIRLFTDTVTDLSPLRGMPLRALHVKSAKVVDASALVGLPLQELYLDECKNLADVAFIGEIVSLKTVTVPMQAANIEALRRLPRLQRLANELTVSSPTPTSTAGEFWKEYDAKKR
jgi:serine/threonine protein kinase/Leucine-rich repeat (LRR) protein